MRIRDLEILYEDNHVLVVNKPAGIPTQGAGPGEPSLVQLAKQYIKSKYSKPGNVYLGVVSRLDSRVSGIVIFARTSKAAARLSSEFAQGTADKTYWAIVEGTPQPPSGSCLDWLIHDDNRQRVVISSANVPGAKEARLSYVTLGMARAGTWLEVKLETGRKHQIRVQLANRGWPIRGDTKYRATQSWPSGIALHARRLELAHPVRETRLELTAPLPAPWRDMGFSDPP
jgi:23S rRNA pseudouridine1911/1915/1917 synthase